MNGYYKAFTWHSNQNNSIFYSGEQKINLVVASGLVIQDQFKSHINQSIYYYSSVMNSYDFLIYHHTPTRQIVKDGIGSPSQTQSPTFSYINWGNFGYVVIVTVLFTIAILILAGILIKKKFQVIDKNEV